MTGAAPIVITGASTGMGKAAALKIASRGLPLVMVCREGPKARAAHAEIVRISGNDAVELETADLSSQAQIRAVAQSIVARHRVLSGLINNAGAIFKRRRLSADGIEMTLATNHLAPFLLTHLLLDQLRAAGRARIVTVSSDAQHPLKFDDLARENRYNSFDVYAQTKLANILFTFELAKRLDGSGVTANCLAPGFIRTEFMRNSAPIIKALIAMFGFLVTDPPEKAADRILHVALDPGLANSSGQFFDKNRPTRARAAAYDAVAQKKLWDISEKLCGLVSLPAPDAAALAP